jgi:hypothetical protein
MPTLAPFPVNTCKSAKRSSFLHSRVASSLAPTSLFRPTPAQRAGGPDRANRLPGFRVAYSTPRAAVVELPVKNRPETGSPPARPFSTPTGWSFVRPKRVVLACPHAEEPRSTQAHANALRGVSKHEGTRRISIPVSAPRAAVAQLPVKNRPETGSPPPRHFSAPAGWFFALSCPGRSAARSGALQTRDRSSPWRSRISVAPLAAARAASHPGHASLGRIRHPYSLVKQPISFPPAHVCARVFATLLRSSPAEGVAERRETFGCSGTRSACPLASKTRVNALVTPHARRLARRLASHDAAIYRAK